MLAGDLSYLVVPLILVLLLAPLWRHEQPFLARQFSRSGIAWPALAKAVAIGLLLRLTWWCQLVIGVAFGFYSNGQGTISGPVFSFQCPPPGVAFLGILVMIVLQPLIEETTHRGYVQTALQRYGFTISAMVSAAAFAAVHHTDSMLFAFFTGLVFATQYRVSEALWSSLITHATVNGLILIDWRCLSGRWNPRVDELPLLLTGTMASLVMLCCLLGIACLLRAMANMATMATEASSTRRQCPGSRRL